MLLIGMASEVFCLILHCPREDRRGVCEYLHEIIRNVQPISTCSGNNRINHSTCCRSFDRRAEQPVLSAYAERTYDIFDSVVRYRHISALKKCIQIPLLRYASYSCFHSDICTDFFTSVIASVVIVQYSPVISWSLSECSFNSVGAY